MSGIGSLCACAKAARARPVAVSAICTAGLCFAMLSTASSSFSSGQPLSRPPVTVASGKAGCPITAASERHSAQSIFLHPRRHAHALRIDLRFQHFRFIRLAGVHQFSLRLCSIFRNFCQIAPCLELFLRCQYAQERHLYCGCDARLLFLRFNLCQLGLRAKHLPAFA